MVVGLTSGKMPQISAFEIGVSELSTVALMRHGIRVNLVLHVAVSCNLRLRMILRRTSLRHDLTNA